MEPGHGSIFAEIGTGIQAFGAREHGEQSLLGTSFSKFSGFSRVCSPIAPTASGSAASSVAVGFSSTEVHSPAHRRSRPTSNDGVHCLHLHPTKVVICVCSVANTQERNSCCVVTGSQLVRAVRRCLLVQSMNGPECCPRPTDGCVGLRSRPMRVGMHGRLT
jgi:hypothetical protein